jgi:hypothetical protein
MAANTFPIYGRTPDVQTSGSLNSGAVLGPTANTAQDGTGTLYEIFQADATEGGFVDRVVVKSVLSPAATVIRIFYCEATGAFTPGTTNTATNTGLLTEYTAAAITTSNTVAQLDIVIPIRAPIVAGHRLLIGFGTSTGAAGTGYETVTFGSKY